MAPKPHIHTLASCREMLRSLAQQQAKNSQLPALSALQLNSFSSHSASSILPTFSSQPSTSSQGFPAAASQLLGQSWKPYALAVEPGAFRRDQLTVHLFLQRHASSKASSAASSKGAAPDANDCDQAVSDYQELSDRLNRLAKPSTIKSWDQVAKNVAIATWNGTKTVVRFTLSIPKRYQDFKAMPKEEWDKKKAGAWEAVKHEAHHFWVGGKLLWYDIKISTRLAVKTMRGQDLTRRERKQLTRTTADIFRLVPLIIVVVVPFMELALPVLLKLFPNMLPSTFEDKLKKEEELKRMLGLKLELARFLQDTVAEMAKDLQNRKSGEAKATADELFQFISRVRSGEPVENSELLRFAQLFNDELTLDNLERVQLVSICQFVGISPFGTDQYLRARLRAHLAQIRQDDYVIETEGLENLTEDELRQACRARGIRAPYGEGAYTYMRRQLQDWLDLSLHRGLPSSLLLLSRAFTITASVKDVCAKKELQYKQLRETMAVIPEEVVDTVGLEQLGHKKGAEALTLKLEFLKREEELIKEEAITTAKAAKAAKAKAASAPAVSAVAAPVDTASAVPAAMAATTEPAAPAPEALEGLSQEEKDAMALAAREKKIRAVVTALMDLASGSAVAKERGMFMDLVQHEIKRLNNIMVKKSSSPSMVFGAKGLHVQGHHDPDHPEEPAASTQLSKRVSKMLSSIEKELDSVESKIGQNLKVLDLDGDGIVSKEELEKAVGYLREQLAPADLQELFTRLGTAADKQNIPVSSLLALAAEGLKPGEQAQGSGSSSGEGAKAAKAQPAEVVAIHTR